MRSLKSQRGATLMVSMIMLMVLTMFVLAASGMSTTDLRIVGNAQSRMAMERAAQQAIEQVLSNIASFDTPAAQTVTVNGISVAVAAPTCQGVSTSRGYTAVGEVTIYDTNWQVTATATDPLTGAQSVLTQGVRIRLPNNFCP